MYYRHKFEENTQIDQKTAKHFRLLHRRNLLYRQYNEL